MTDSAEWQFYKDVRTDIILSPVKCHLYIYNDIHLEKYKIKTYQVKRRQE